MQILSLILWGGLIQFALVTEAANSIPPQKANVYWGASTNGIMAGIYVEAKYDNNLNHDIILCHPLLYNSSTNNGNIQPDVLLLYLPSLESRYRMELTDEKGNNVEKTEKGQLLGKIAPKPYKLSPNFNGVINDTGWRPGKHFLLSRQVDELFPQLILQDYFKITNSGLFHLHFEMRAFKVIDSQTNSLICFPPVDANIEINLN